MTLAQLKNLYTEFFKKHKQINHCFYGDLTDYVAIPDKNYFSVNIQYNSSNVSGKYINHNYTITISDLMNLNYLETEHSAISNCMEIAKDFIAFLTYNDDISSVSPSIQPFREATGDITAGVVLGINVQLFMSLNECAIPIIDDNPTTTTTTSTSSTTIEPTTTSTTSTTTSTSTTLEPTTSSTTSTSTTIAPTTSTTTSSTTTVEPTTSTSTSTTTITSSSTSSTTSSTTTVAPTTSTTTLAPTTSTTTTTASGNPMFLTTINGWNTYVKLPDDYNTNTSKYHPAIVYFVGRGEVGSDASKILLYGPMAFVNSGWDGRITNADGVTEQAIIIGMQQPIEFQKPASTIAPSINGLLSTYRIDPLRLNLTGFSAGGYCAGIYVTGDTYPGGPYTYANKIASFVSVQGVQPDDNTPHPQVWDNYALSGGKYLGFEQSQDNRNIPAIVSRLNGTVAGSGIYIQTNFGDGSHGYTEFFYNPTATFTINGKVESLYAWQLRQVRIAPTTTTSTSSTTSTTTSSSTTLAPTTSTTTTSTTLSPTTTTSTTIAPTTTTSSTTSTTTTVAPTTTTTTSSSTTTTTTTIVTQAKFNFGPSTDTAVAGWNSVFGDPLTAARSATDSATGIGILSLGTYNGSTNTAWGKSGTNCAVDGGFSTGNNSGLVPDLVAVGYWFNTKNAQTSPARVDGVEINGLVPGATYTLQFFVSRNNSSSRLCTYDITDANGTTTTSPSFQAKNNSTTYVTVTGKVAKTTGKITFGCHGDLGSADQTNDIYGFLNALIITRTA